MKLGSTFTKPHLKVSPKVGVIGFAELRNITSEVVNDWIDKVNRDHLYARDLASGIPLNSNWKIPAWKDLHFPLGDPAVEYAAAQLIVKLREDALWGSFGNLGKHRTKPNNELFL